MLVEEAKGLLGIKVSMGSIYPTKRGYAPTLLNGVLRRIYLED